MQIDVHESFHGFRITWYLTKEETKELIEQQEKIKSQRGTNDAR